MCPSKKAAVSKKLNIQKAADHKKATTTYANVAKETLKREGSQHTIVQLQSDLHVKIIICMLQAHLHNMANPGQYGAMLNEMLQNNGINQKIKVPDSPDSFKVFGAIGPNVTVPGTENTDQDAEDALNNDSVNTSSSTNTTSKSNKLSSTTSSLPSILATPTQSSDDEESRAKSVSKAVTRETDKQNSIREALVSHQNLIDDLNVQLYSTSELDGATTETLRALHRKKKLKVSFSALPQYTLNSADIRGLLLDGSIPLSGVDMIMSNMSQDAFLKLASGPIAPHVRPRPQRVASSPKGKNL
jgi:hypothetical protein